MDQLDPEHFGHDPRKEQTHFGRYNLLESLISYLCVVVRSYCGKILQPLRRQASILPHFTDRKTMQQVSEKFWTRRVESSQFSILCAQTGSFSYSLSSRKLTNLLVSFSLFVCSNQNCINHFLQRLLYFCILLPTNSNSSLCFQSMWLVDIS